MSQIEVQGVFSPISKDIAITAFPDLDIRRAQESSAFAASESPPGYESLRLALALSIYNAKSPQEEDIALARNHRLVEIETQASDPGNPLATIGVEVECPTKTGPYFNSSYGEFFDALGMPRNKINKLKQNPTYETWEFSPDYSYSAQAQSRIISQLIKGRFIGSLTAEGGLLSKQDTQDPNLIAYFLDPKLISLHVNLGIPNGNLRNVSEIDITENDDIQLFVAAFALAFSSPLRLAKKMSAHTHSVKTASVSPKSEHTGSRRLEVKALEVRTENVYRLLRQSQVIGSALLSALNGEESPLSECWTTTAGELTALFYKEKFDVSRLIDREYLPQVAQTGLPRRLRTTITSATLRALQVIESPTN